MAERIRGAPSAISSPERCEQRCDENSTSWLFGCQQASKPMNHVRDVFQGRPVEEYHCWVYSTTVLYWIKGQGTWTQFVRNRTQAVQVKGYLKWHYVPTSENPSDQGSRGDEPRRMGRLCFDGPNWLSSPDKWPSPPEVCETSETVVETVKPKLENQML